MKQIVLTDQQRDALIRMLAATDMTVDQIVTAARRVTDKTTFGRIAFEHWLEAEPEPEKVTVRGECSYCGTEWWGPVELKCPKCFPSKSAPKPKQESIPNEVMALLAPLERKMEMR